MELSLNEGGIERALCGKDKKEQFREVRRDI